MEKEYLLGPEFDYIRARRIMGLGSLYDEMPDFIKELIKDGPLDHYNAKTNKKLAEELFKP